MVEDRTSITRELDSLIHLQIQTFKQDAAISESEMTEYKQRSQQIRALCRSLNQVSFWTWSDSPSVQDRLQARVASSAKEALLTD